MEIASIKGDTVLLLYHPAEAAADVGQQFSLLEVPDRTDGLVVQVISNDSLEYVGLQQEMIQRILEQRATMNRLLDREAGMGEIKSIKLATAKIRKRISEGKWLAWDGWIPTRHVDIVLIDGETLLGNVSPSPTHPLGTFASFGNTPIQLDGPRLNMVNVVAGVKGSGKSHLAKHLVLALSKCNVPCLVFDINGEYTQLPRAQVLTWGDNYLPDLADVGYEMLETMIRMIYPFQPGSASESVFESRLANIYNQRREHCRKNNQLFTLDIPYLLSQKWSGGDYVVDAIKHRLNLIEDRKLFATGTTKVPVAADKESKVRITSLKTMYDNAAGGAPIVFDMRDLSASLQQALVRSVNQSLETICNEETNKKTGRYPFVFFEEAHFYISENNIVNIITRGRHIGMASVFVTNTPQKLPDTVFRQLDNLFLLSLTHRDDIRNVSKNSFTDEATIESFATRMPERHALFIGNVTDRYPLVVKVNPLPSEVPASGRTRSTWDRMTAETKKQSDIDTTAVVDESSQTSDDDIPF